MGSLGENKVRLYLCFYRDAPPPQKGLHKCSHTPAWTPLSLQPPSVSCRSFPQALAQGSASHPRGRTARMKHVRGFPPRCRWADLEVSMFRRPFKRKTANVKFMKS